MRTIFQMIIASILTVSVVTLGCEELDGGFYDSTPEPFAERSDPEILTGEGEESRSTRGLTVSQIEGTQITGTIYDSCDWNFCNGMNFADADGPGAPFNYTLFLSNDLDVSGKTIVRKEASFTTASSGKTFDESSIALQPVSGSQKSTSIKMCEEASCTWGGAIVYDGVANQLQFGGLAQNVVKGPHMTINRDNGTVTIPGTLKTAKISAGEIIVQTSWADYVFENDYDLMPLEDVEMFIDSNQHLPGVPSAAEVQNNGVSLGESQAKLLEKIEELTLYLIEQNKNIAELKQQVATLQGQPQF